jgi:hypothetical protein
MIKKKDPSTPALQQSPQTKDAVFMGWQRMRSGEEFPLYNITAAGHPSFGSTVTDRGLRKLNLQVPWTPFTRGSGK